MWDFGQADVLEPEAIGEPGKRRFRLKVLSGTEAASLWLEKEQLAALTVAIRQLLEQTGEAVGSEQEPVRALDQFPDQPKVDLQIGRLGIGYDEQQRVVAIYAYKPEEPENAPPTFSCHLSRGQCRTFADQAEEVIGKGRPACELCGGPVDPQGHICPRQNGHSKLPISLE
ncbi:MAG: DUF3090 family protein [Dehalococcoidia bacterium]